MSRTTETLVATYYVRLICDCGEEMKASPVVYSTYPPMMEYVCPKCGCRETHREQYPRIVYKSAPQSVSDNRELTEAQE